MIRGCFVAAWVWQECHTLLPLKVQNPPYRFPCSDGVAAHHAYESALCAEYGRAVASQHLRQIVLAALRYPCGRMCAETVSHSMPFTAIVGKPTARARRCQKRSTAAERASLRPPASCRRRSQQRQSVGRTHEAQPVRISLPSSVR